MNFLFQVTLQTADIHTTHVDTYFSDSTLMKTLDHCQNNHTNLALNPKS